MSFRFIFVQDSKGNEQDYVDLGLSCADVCKTLDRELNGRRWDELSPPVAEAIEELTTTVAAIQKKIVKDGKRNLASRLLHTMDDKNKVAAWSQVLLRVLQVFNTELVIHTHEMATDIHRNVRTVQEGTSSQHQSAQASVSLGELPPPPPRACFGRDPLIEKGVELAENLEPFALIGAGGIGKTSIALSVLHHTRIENQFGDNRRFIRCDQFPASSAHFLARLSKVIGAGIENPEDMISLRPFLSAKEMLIILDNAESVLDPQGTDAREIYAIVDELCQLKTVCLCITSRITTVPPHCARPEIPTLSMEAACDTFYGIYRGGKRSDIINILLQRLDFHALSITLLATTASHNVWDHNRLVKEWDAQRARVLRTDYNESLAATIELSLASPTFCKLGPDARDLLGVVAFFPQGIDEQNLDWFFPTISDRQDVFDKFCVLSLAYRNNGFVTMLAPIRDYLGPKDPKSSPLLCAIRDCYFSRLSVKVDPDIPGFGETRWIVSEGVNVEHLLDVFTSIDANSCDVWDSCDSFMTHLHWHKPRQTVLRQKIEGLPDDHPSKPGCLFALSRLFSSGGNHAERKKLLAHSLKLERASNRGDVLVVQYLIELSCANREVGLCKEGIQQAKEASEICERIGNIKGQLRCSDTLAWLFLADGQIDAAEDALLRLMELLPEEGQEFTACRSHRIIGEIYLGRGEKGKAIHHLEAALGIASRFDWHNELFWVHYTLAKLFYHGDEFDDANTHIEQAKPHIDNNTYRLGYTMEMQASVWFHQGRLEDAKSEALGALENYERLGAVQDVETCRDVLQGIEQAIKSRSTNATVQCPGEDSSSH